ncbi:MAG: FHA domain-containing protein [Myxococcales bacterium]|nr:FHA domain-containing protein [Myxococcales bacterium]
MGFFSRVGAIFGGGKRSRLARARRLEAIGSLEDATAAYLDLGERDAAAQVLVVRAEAAVDNEKRRLLLAQAAGLAEGARAREIERKRASLVLELKRSGAYAPTRVELEEMAGRLERAGEATLAAEVYGLIGDREGETRMLVEAGAIERLEQVLDSEQTRVRAEREVGQLHARVHDLWLSGARRAAMAAGASARESDRRIDDLLREIEHRRVMAPRLTLSLAGERTELLFGDEISVGRADATLVIASPALSRTHLMIRRTPRGPQVLDLDSKNGTFLSGVRLGAPLPVNAPLELSLGGEVSLELRPWNTAGVCLSHGTSPLFAPLGPFELGGWSITPGADGWLSLDLTSPAFLAGLSVIGRIELLIGDRLSRAPAGPVELEVLA